MHRASTIRSSRLRRCAIWAPQSQPAQRWGRRRGRGDFSKGLPGPSASCCGHGDPPNRRAPTHPDFRTPAPRERRSGSRSPRTAGRRRAHRRPPAARTPGARPRTLTRAAHSRRRRPHPCARELRVLAPRAGRTPDPSCPHRGSAASCPWKPGAAEATLPAIAEASAARASRSRAHLACPARTRGAEEGAAPYRGLAQRIADWGTHTHARTPPIATSAAQKVAGGVAVPAQRTGSPGIRRLPHVRGRRPGARDGRGAGLRRRSAGRGRQPSQPGTRCSPTALGASYGPA